MAGCACVRQDAATDGFALCAKVEPLLCDEDMSMLIGIGGYIAHLGKSEMTAEIEMKMALARAKGRLS